MQFSAAIVGLMAGLMAPPAVLDLCQSSLPAGAASPEAEIGRKISSLLIRCYSVTVFIGYSDWPPSMDLRSL